MSNRLFLILSILFVGVLTPNFTAADGEIAIRGIDTSRDAETVIPVVVETKPAQISAPVVSRAVNSPRPAAQTTVKTTISGNQINIAGRTLNITQVASTEINAGNHVNKYGNKLLYGHNTTAVFGGLKNLGVGSTFTVTENGVATTYKVAKAITFEKNNGQLQLNGEGSYMNSVAKARSNGVNYDLALMTCAGTNYGNGDASHRLVLFATRV